MNLNLDKGAWKRVRLGDVIRRSREQVDPVGSGVERYVAGGHIDSEGVTIERWGHVDDGQMGSTFRYIFGPGQVLFVSARPYLRKVGVPDFEGVVADKTYVLDAIPENGLLPEFLPFVISSERFVEYATAEATGSMNPRLLWGPMQRYEFDLPPLDEQQRIADLLWTVEHSTRSARRLWDASKKVERAWTVSALDYPGDSRTLQRVGTVLMGRQRAPQYAKGDHLTPYLRVANVGDDQLKLSDVKEMNFNPAERERYSVVPGDILVSEGQSRELVGQSVRITNLPQPMCFQNTLIRFRADESQVSSEFAYSLIRALFYTGHFSDIASQTTSIAHLGVKRFAEFVVPIPAADVQQQHVLMTQKAQAVVREAEQLAESNKRIGSAISEEVFT